MSRIMNQIATHDHRVNVLLERLVNRLERFVQRLQSAKIYAELTAFNRDGDTVDFMVGTKIEGIGRFRSDYSLALSSLDQMRPELAIHTVEDIANRMMTTLLAEMFITSTDKPIVYYTPSGQRLVD